MVFCHFIFLWWLLENSLTNISGDKDTTLTWPLPYQKTPNFLPFPSFIVSNFSFTMEDRTKTDTGIHLGDYSSQKISFILKWGLHSKTSGISLIFKDCFLFYSCVCTSVLCECMPRIFRCPRRPQEGLRSHGTVVTGSCDFTILHYIFTKFK